MAGQRRAVLRIVEDLQIDGGEVMVRVRIELALVLGEWLNLDLSASVVRVGLGAGEAVDVGILRLEAAEHVVEGAVLHHEDHDVLKVLNAGQRSIEWHGVPPGRAF